MEDFRLALDADVLGSSWVSNAREIMLERQREGVARAKA